MKNDLVRFGSFVFAIFTVSIISVQGQENPDALYTNLYDVPPTFGSPVSGAAVDPFADPVPERKQVDAKEVLEAAGVFFPDGGSAIYKPKTSQLIVRTTKDQMLLVEAYIDSIVGVVESQIYLQVFFIESDTELWKQPVVDGKQVADDSHFFSESMLSGKRMIELLGAADLKSEIEAETVKSATNTLVNLGAEPAGVFTDPQLQVMLEATQKAKGVKLIKAPSGMSRSGQSAFFRVGDYAVVVDSVLGADNFTVDLNLAIRQQMKQKDGSRRVERSQITLWDMQTVALVEKTESKKFIYTFVRPQIVDPAGIPINEQPEEISAKE